jgi:hypothetical protein
MTNDEALEMLLNHPDPKMREAGKLWSEHLDRCIEKFTGLHQTLQNTNDTLVQLNLDLKYLVFDLEATRRERDALKGPE